MREVHIRLQKARRQAGYETATDAARAFGWNENTYRSHENGERGIKSGVAERYARALRINLLWLLYGDTEPQDRTSSQIGGLIHDGGRVTIAGNMKVEVNLPVSISDTAKCFFVYTNNMYPRYAKGDLVVCWPDEKTDLGGSDRFNEGIAVFANKQSFFGSLLYTGENQIFEVFARPPIRQPKLLAFHPAHLVVRLGRFTLHDLAEIDALARDGS